MKSTIHFVIRNKLAVWMLTIIVAISGIYAGMNMKQEYIPDISVPYVLVMTVYPGAAPDQVMEEVSIPVEDALEELKGVRAVYSNSFSNMSSVQVEFEYGTDMEEAERQIRNTLDTLKLPDEAMEPTITRLSMNLIPVIALSVSHETEDLADLTAIVENVLVPELKKLDGVASVQTSGQYVEKVVLSYDQAKMAALGLTEDTVKGIVQASEVAFPLGLYPFDDAEKALVVNGKVTTVEELGETLIPVTPTADHPMPFVRLAEIATLETVGQAESISRTNGKTSIGIQISKSQEANTVEVANAVKDLVRELQDRYKGLNIDVTLDQGKPVQNSIHAMISKALYGAGFAILVILLFLRDIKSTIISVISIPLSILIALLLLWSLDITLNLMTLGAMTVAIGRVIDDSIVVVENIYRRLRLKDEPLKGRDLIRSATIEMFKPILSSTLVTVAVFAPLVFVGGMVGELFMPFAMTMAFALGASLLVAITVVPSLSHTLFKKQLTGQKSVKSHREHGALASAYKRMLDWSLRHKAVTFLTAVVLLVASLFLLPVVGVSFIDTSASEKVMYFTYTPAKGEDPETTNANIAEVEKMMMARDDVEIVQVAIGGSGNPMMAMMGGGSNGALLFVIFDPDTPHFDRVMEELTEQVTSLETSGTWKTQDFSSFGFASDEMSYTVYGYDLERVKEAVRQIEAAMNEAENIADVSTSLSDVYTQYTLHVNRELAMQNGLTAVQLAMMLNPNQSEEVLTTLKKDGRDLEVVIRKDVQTAETFEQLLDRPIPTATGQTVRLGDLVKVEEGEVASQLDRSKGQYYASVTGKITSKDVSAAASELDRKIRELELPDGVVIGESGVMADIEETFSQLIVAMIVAVLIVYFILIVTFGEGLAPFAILFSLPFILIGALVGLWISGETLSVTAMMGLLMLIGIVVTNAIVLVDRIIHKEREGLAMREAILEAGATRLRPILMTALATIGALLPLVIGVEAGVGFISKGLAVTVIGGLTSSTLLTLVIVPIVYEWLSKLFRKNRREEEAKWNNEPYAVAGSEA